MDPFLERVKEVFNQIAGIVSGCDYDPRRDMHFIDPKTIEAHRWELFRDTTANSCFWAANSLDSVCPYCNQFVTLTVKPVITALKTQSIAAEGICPRCQDSKKIRVFFTGIQPETNKPWSNGIWFEPIPNIRSFKFKEISDRKILNAYKEAINSLNQNLPRSAITHCGVIVERIGRTKFPHVVTGKKSTGGKEAKTIGPIFDLLRSELKGKPEFKELLTPLLELGEALRVGRNSGGHFNFEYEPDRELAEQVIDLTEFLIRYIYVISNEASNVNEIITKLESSEEDTE